MKKRTFFLLAICIVAIISSMASAELIGVSHDGRRPDIVFNNTGSITYGASNDSFVLSADDLKIVYADGSMETLTYYGNFRTAININLNVDSAGNLVGSGTMVEEVVEGEVFISGVTYVVGDVILAGTVYDFGWSEPGSGQLGSFDFLVSDVSGGLVVNGVWPSDVDTGITAWSEDLGGWGGSWSEDFFLDTVKGNKAPVPEPMTMALLGLGGLALIRRRKAA